MKSSVRGLTTATLALAAAFGVSVIGPHRAYAAPDSSTASLDGNLALTVLSPTAHASFSGTKPIEISAFYQGSDSNQITELELYVDGAHAFTKTLQAPETRGVISFLIDVSQLSAGAHTVVVRAVADDAEVVSGRTSFVFISDSSATQPSDSATNANQNGLPDLSYLTPSMDDKVTGTVKISLKATEQDGKSPYVSVFVDKAFKTLRNYPPYEYDWDTTTYTNGYHTIEAYGYDENQNVGPAQILRVYVNNPGGRTDLRTDLMDAPASAPAPVTHAARKPAPTLASAVQKHRNSAKTGTLLANRIATVNGLQSDNLGLSSPFVTNTPTVKSFGPARRPSPLLSTSFGTRRTYLAGWVMLAKRLELLDETGGLNPQSELSDPYIPETTTPIPASQPTVTPVAGFKPLPTKASVGSPSLAVSTAIKPKSHFGGPALMHEAAHTESVQLTLPGLAQPTVQTIVPIAEIKAAIPIAKPKIVNVHVATPIVAHPKAVIVHAATPVLTHPKAIAVHTAAPAIARPMAQVKMHVATPVAARPKSIADHMAAPQIASPVTQKIHLSNPAASEAKQQLIHIARHPIATAPTLAIHVTAPETPKLIVHVPSTVVHHTVDVHVGANTSSLLRATGEMSILYNHTTLRLDRPLQPREGVMFSPLRQIFEFQGGTLTWQKKTGIVHATNEGKDIVLTIGKRQATLNQKPTTLQMAPYLNAGRTMVPLSFLPMALDVNVQFDKATGHLLVTTKN